MAKVIDRLNLTIDGNRSGGSRLVTITYDCVDEADPSLRTNFRQVQVPISQFMLQAASFLTPLEASALWYLAMNNAEQHEGIAQTVPPGTPDWPYGAVLAPSNLVHNGVRVSWQQPFSSAPVTGYKVFANGVEVASLAAGVYQHDLTGLTPESTYVLKVEATQDGVQWTTDGPIATVVTPAAPPP